MGTKALYAKVKVRGLFWNQTVLATQEANFVGEERRGGDALAFAIQGLLM